MSKLHEANSAKKMFKICIIGCGVMALNQHGPACKRYEAANTNVQLAACCDINGEKAKSLAEQFDIPAWYTDIDEMLDTVQPNAVCLIAPVDKTAMLSCKIMQKGYPLILEKPPGIFAEETIQMIQTANAGKVPNMVAFNRRHMPIVRSVVDMIDKWGGVECILDISYRMVRHNRTDPHFSTTAIHGIDLVRYLAQSSYKSVDFRYNELPEAGPTVANFHMSCEMENGILTNLAFLPISSVNTERLDINTTKGLLTVQLPIWHGCIDGNGKIEVYCNGEISQSICGSDIADPLDDFILGGFYNENAKFFDALRNGNTMPCDISDSLQVVEIATCIDQRVPTYSI